jgi:flagellar biosynthesis chaperone FliJ
MSEYKYNQYIQNFKNEIYQNSNDYKMFELGVAIGNFQLLDLIKGCITEDLYKQCINELSNNTGKIGEHFKNLREAYNSTNTNAEDLAEKLNKYRSNNY